MTRLAHALAAPFACLAAITLLTGAAAQDTADQAGQRIGDPYPLATCPVSGEALGSMGDPVVLLLEGREVRLCCKGCVKDFETNAAAHMAKIDEAIIAQQLPLYPTEQCVVSEEPLEGDMGAPVNFVYANRLVRFCCRMCRLEFMESPDKFLAKIDALIIEKQAPGYPLTECIIAGDPLGSMEDSINMVYAGRLVRFCCEGCTLDFEENPARHLAALDAAWRGEAAQPGAAEGHEGHEH